MIDAPVIAFTKVKRPWGWLNNMSAHKIAFDGDVWPTAEALFQALRFAPRNPVREWIRREHSPMRAKFVAKRFQDEMIVPQRSELDLENMRKVLRLKVGQHAESLRPRIDELLASGDARIVEDCTWRRGGSGLFWGAALVDPERGIWEGENWLGRLWMEVRAELRLSLQLTDGKDELAPGSE